MADDIISVPALVDRGPEVHLPESVPVATRIATTYWLILRDSLTLDEHSDDICARLLTSSLWYFLLGPLKDVYLSAAPGYEKGRLQGAFSRLQILLLVSEIRRRGLQEATNYVGTLDARMRNRRMISAASPLELLARLCWRRAEHNGGRFASLGKSHLILPWTLVY
jgi:hypothetical protein